MVDEQVFKIGADGIDTEQLVAGIRRIVAEKAERGAYTDIRIAKAERLNLQNLQDDEFLAIYLDCLREAAYVDIGDFEIVERRQRFAPILVRLKRAIWSILKFYTYRLWSQQNEINGLLLSTVDSLDQRYRKRIRDLESRLESLERQGADKT